MMKSKPVHRCRRVYLGFLLLMAACGAAWSQAPDFSGLWKQDNDRCRPARKGDITLRIEQNVTYLTVETTILRGLSNSRHAVQKYTLDGQVSVSTGADGDEFHTSVAWRGASLVFSVEEHEDGRILQSKETWSLIDNGAALERIRERPGGENQLLIYRRLQ